MITVSLPYIGSGLSVNHCYWNVRSSGGRVQRVLKRETRLWMGVLTSQIRGKVEKPLVPPIEVTISGVFRNRRECCDLSNLHKIISDAVEDALEINDKYFRLRDGETIIDNSVEPKLIIEIREVR